ncbi:hypothetical protein C8R47DRAFT_1130617 [Mycena vitilis]|nr:hypothetical protein C8R47DRAFT_1130617 [Mycena vitilis]
MAVSGLIFLITMHHRRDGHLLTQTQEEMVLIFCFGLFWMSVLLAWHWLRSQSGDPIMTDETDAGVPAVRRDSYRPARQVRPYPCSIDDAYCIVEDYTFF